MRLRRATSRLHRAGVDRAIVRVLVLAQIAGALPQLALAQTPARARTAVRAPRAAAPPAPTPVVPTAVTPAKPIVPNRTVPAVTPPDLTVAFGASPSTEALMRKIILPELLSPVGTPTLDDNRAVARALEALAAKGMADGVAELERFVQASEGNPWRASVLANLGTLRARDGYFTRAAGYWAEAWRLTRDREDPHARQVADYAIGEALHQAMTFGQVSQLRAMLTEVERRPVRGAAATRVGLAREGLWILENKHETAIFSGPEALKALLTETGRLTTTARDTIAAYTPGHEGTTLVALRALGQQAGVSLRMRRVEDLTTLALPAIVHLKTEHFTTAVKRFEDGSVLLHDSAIGAGAILPAAAFADEATGYVLVPYPAADGYPVEDAEGATVLGHCTPGVPWSDEPCGCGGNGPNRAMPGYALHPVTASLIITDTPLFYTPPRGPAVNFTLMYNQRTQRTDTTPTFSNVARLWSMSWVSYISDNNSSAFPPYAWNDVFTQLEGRESVNQYDGPTNPFSRATVGPLDNNRPGFKRQLPDGTVEEFTFPDRGNLPGRRWFLTQTIDPQGQALTYTYDANIRLVAVTDAVGQVTTLDYADTANPLRVTRVVDPFGRSATLTYDAQGQLETVTDMAGLTSRFSYGETNQYGVGLVTAMTTPYGTTTFKKADLSENGIRRLDATDPEGGTERVEWHFGATAGQPAAAPASEVPAGFEAWNYELDLRNSLYWDKQAMAEAPGDVSRAVVTHWLWDNPKVMGSHPTSRNIPHSIKRPLEPRIWYRYPDQQPTTGTTAGTGRSPSLTARVLEGGVTQLTQTTYNSLGMVTSKTDALGRQTTFTYAPNGLDLLEVRQIKPGGSDLLASYGGYNAQHLPGTITDTAGQTTTITYNASGRPLTVTNAKNETTTYAYDTGPAGHLLSVTGPVAGATTTYTYDPYGRVRTVTDADSYTITTDYDALNRPTRQTYPDGTYEETTYQRLDAVTERDRVGRVTRHFYDRAGRRTSTVDPLGRVIRQEWCTCGSLNALVDANGNRTNWTRDARGRVTVETRADGTTKTFYTYDLAGRLKTVTDPKGQVTTNTYLLDDSLSNTVYTNAAIPTPGVAYTYDPVYSRVATMVDGIGTTSYTYKATGQLGAGQVATVDGPFANDVIAFTYDQLGRVTNRTIDGAANSMNRAFDALGRVTSEQNVLGTFTYGYDGVSSRLATVNYPNGQTSSYSYLPTTQDHRLQTIHHRYPNTATLSKFDYTYDAVGNIVTWRQQADSAATLWTYGYDAANQLTRAVQQTTDPTPTILKRYGYGYDLASNRTHEQIDNAVVAATHDNLNRLLTHSPGGPIIVAGTTSEPATITIQARPAAVDASNAFRGTAATTSGTNTFTVTATDPSGNQATRQYQVPQSGLAKTFTYDANGNLASDGARTFEWNAQNNLVGVQSGAQRIEYRYDGFNRRVRQTVSANAVVVSDRLIVWCETQLCEEREVGGAVMARFMPHGQQRGQQDQLLTHDHLGSVREVVVGSTVERRFEFDPWGRRTMTGTPGPDDRSYTGHTAADETNLVLSRYRAYDADLARWLSRDPAGAVDGDNRYSYVRNNPLALVDPHGLAADAPSSVGPDPTPLVFIPPAGCKVTSTRLIGTSTETSIMRDWRLVGTQMVQWGAGEDDGPSPIGGSCACIYELKQVYRVTQTVFTWRVEMSCCDRRIAGHYQTYGERSYEAIGVLSGPNGWRRILRGTVIGDECFCPPRFN